MNVFELLPHRAPAIWIDEATPDGCYVVLRADAPYMTNGVLRRTSLIEFIAQGFGYQAALTGSGTAAQKAFLVAVTKCTLHDTSSLREGDRLKVSVSDINVVGPITLFNALVTHEDRELARASLKVFAS